MSKKVSKSQPNISQENQAAPAGNTVPVWAFYAPILTAYAAALIYARQTVPSGINNDVAEEALRGLYLVSGHHFEVITFAVGNSAETLYLYLMGVSTALLGAGTLAIQVVSWLFALGCIVLVARLATKISAAIPEWVGALAAASSLWLFHYARSGLRAISAPLFLALFALTLDRAERKPGDRWASLTCGAVLGLSIYAYTSDRALMVAFAGFVAWRLLRGSEARASALQRYAWIAAGALAVSLPNLWFFVQRPSDFLSRGSYVFHGAAPERAANLLWSILFPFYFPDRYRDLYGPAFQFDGVAAGLTGAGFNPLPIVVSAAFVYGLWRTRALLASTVPAILIATWFAVILSIGFAGPSPTRLLILFPFYAAFAAAGFAYLFLDRPTLRIPVLLAMLSVGLAGGIDYLSGPAALSQFYARAATPIGEEAEQLAARGERVLCIVSSEAGVVRYLTYGQQARVKIAEFYQRDLNPAELPFDEFRGGTVLIERTPRFAPFTARFPAQWVTHEERFDSVRLPAQ